VGVALVRRARRGEDHRAWPPSPLIPPDRQVLLCLGIHGQMIFLDRETGLVAVKVSSWPMPQDPWKLFSTLAAFEAINIEMAQAR
jgi:CubicO group peptidase (beta-lactamase class C family)